MTEVSSIQHPEMIAVDWEIHQLIELERKGYDEKPSDALRRLLGLDKPKQRVRVKAGRSETDWSSSGVTLKEGTTIRFSYRKNTKPIMGVIAGGKIVAAGREYDSLSSAANDLAVTTKGHKTKLNGWIYWSVQRPENSGNWVLLDQLRKEAKGA